MHKFSGEDVPDPWRDICPPTTMYLFPLRYVRSQWILLPVLLYYWHAISVKTERRQLITTIYIYCLFRLTYKYTVYHHYCYSWPGDQKVCRWKTVVPSKYIYISFLSSLDKNTARKPLDRTRALCQKWRRFPWQPSVPYPFERPLLADAAIDPIAPTITVPVIVSEDC